jgi:hypothetical protein
VVATAEYRFTLVDGRLALFACSNPGGACGAPWLSEDYDYSKRLCDPGIWKVNGFPDDLRSGLEHDLPDQFYQQTVARQLVPSPDVYCGDAQGHPDDALCQAKNIGPCDPATLLCHDAWDCTTEADCLVAQNIFAGAVGLGADFLGLHDQGQLATTARQDANWTCAPHTLHAPACGGGVQGRCQYILRAKRLNVNSDTVELVWFDDVTDFTNPALAAFAASFVDPADPLSKRDVTRYQALCSRKPRGIQAASTAPNPALNYDIRSWFNYWLPSFASPGPTGQCPAEPANPPQCGCQQDADCPCGVTCDPNTHRCENLCFTGADCASGICYTNLNRCGSGETCSLGVCPFAYESCVLGICQAGPANCGQ